MRPRQRMYCLKCDDIDCHLIEQKHGVDTFWRNQKDYAFNDNDSLTADNKFAKIRHLLNVLNKSLLQFDRFKN